MNTSLKRTLQFLLFLSFGIFLIWLSIKNISQLDAQQIKTSFLNAKFFWILMALGALFLSHVTRALRWRLLITSLGYFPSKKNLVFGVFIGYLVNLAFPRLGEILKCTTISKYEKIPVDTLLGTIIMERAIDILSMLFIFMFTFWIQPEFIKKIYIAVTAQSHTQIDAHNNAGFFTFFLISTAILIIAIFMWMYITDKSTQDLKIIVKNIARRISEGVLSIKKLKQGGLFIFYTVAIWCLYGISGYFGFLMLSEMSFYGLKEALMILCSGSIGMILTPGGIGAYTFVTQKTMELYGASTTAALTYGWLLWLIQTGMILIGGLFSFALLPFANKATLDEKKL